jgi:hypothetical protein
VFALAAVAASVVLQAGQVQWFMPGTLQPGQVVGCSIGGRVVSAKVPTSGSGLWAWKGNASMAISRATSGAVEAACNTQLAPPRRPTMPYVIGKNGVALIRGANHRSQLERRYGRPTTTRASAGRCAVVWRRAALQASFRSCAKNAVLVRATARSSRWASITGVHVGDPLPRVLFEAPYAKRLSAKRWRLAASHHHELVAEIGAHGRVVRLVATLG